MMDHEREKLGRGFKIHPSEATASNRKMVIPQKEAAMRIALRCAECDSEDPKIVSLRNPAYEHYCSRACFLKGQENYIRWILRMKSEAEAEVAT